MESLTEKLPMAMTMMGDIQLHANELLGEFVPALPRVYLRKRDLLRLGVRQCAEFEPPSQPTHRPHRLVDKSVAEAPWWCLATGASIAHLSVLTKNQIYCTDCTNKSVQYKHGITR